MLTSCRKQQALHFDAWPECDRVGWRNCLPAADILDASNYGALWACSTRKSVQGSYARWLYWLQETHPESLGERPEARVSMEIIGAYVKSRQDFLSAISIASALHGIAMALGVIVPGFRQPWLSRLTARIRRKAGRTRKGDGNHVPTHDIYSLGLALMEQAGENGLSALKRAILFRDGLMIAVLARRPLRLANFLGIELGKTLVRQHGKLWLTFRGTQTKNGMPLRLTFPRSLEPHLTFYLKKVRPILYSRANPPLSTTSPKGETHNLWISQLGSNLSRNAFYCLVKARTRRAFGDALSPHRFRDSMATSVAAENSPLLWTLPHILGHRSPQTSAIYYNRARGLWELEEFHSHVEALRRSAHKFP